jgi:hypothetical protein
VVLAIAVATPGGIGSLTIRLLSQGLGVKPVAQTASHTPQPFVLVSVLIRTPRGLGALIPITHRTTLDA